VSSVGGTLVWKNVKKNSLILGFCSSIWGENSGAKIGKVDVFTSEKENRTGPSTTSSLAGINGFFRKRGLMLKCKKSP